MVSEGNWTNGTAGDEDGRTPRVVFLALIMLTACLLNLLLLFAFVHNKKARQSVQSVAVVNLAALCLGDCVLNMTLVMGSLAAGQDWTFSQDLCKWHSFVMSLVLVETSLLLTVLVCDRFLAVRYLEKYDSLISPVRLVIVLVFTWVQALGFSVPFFLDTVKTTFQLKLHTCSVSDETSLVFICLASVLCFLVPAVIIVAMFAVTLYSSHKQQPDVKMMVTHNHYCDQVKQEPELYKEMCTVRYVGVLCLLWLVLEIPHVVTTYIQQYRLSSQLSFSVDYPWGVDVAFIWMRFSFSALFPCVTFVWRRDLWHCCKEHLVCHRSNSVLDIKVTVDPSMAKKAAGARPKTIPLPPKLTPKSKDRDQPKAEVPSLLSFNVPVLFATSDGIHIETPCSDASEPEDADADLRDHRPKGPKGRQLDITIHTADHDRLSGDTSDYDSEGEGYSSQPLSTRHIRGALETTSTPNLCGEGQHERGAPAPTTLTSTTPTLTSSQGADSGLELSGLTASSTDKKAEEQVSTSTQYPPTDCATASSTDLEPNLPQNNEDAVQKSLSSSTPKTSTETKVNMVTEAHSDSRYSQEAGETRTVHPSLPPSLPKVKGRLKPLHPANPKPPRSKTDWPERNITMKPQARKSDDGAAVVVVVVPDSKTIRNVSGSSGSVSGSGLGSDTDIKTTRRSHSADRTSGGRSSKESRGRGHKRTVTSDSERALLSSDSSVEIQTVKVQSVGVDGREGDLKTPRGDGACLTGQ